MPQLPAWSPPVELSSRLEGAATQLAALAPPLQKVRADGSLDAAATQRLAEAASAEWEAALRELEREVDLQHHPRGCLALRLAGAGAALRALADVVRWRARGDGARCRVLRLLASVCRAEPDAAFDLATAGLHGVLARALDDAGAENGAAEDTTSNAEHDQLVAELVEAIVGAGCAFPSAGATGEAARPAPAVFSLCAGVPPAGRLLLRQVPQLVREHFEVGYKLWPNALLLSRWLVASSPAGLRFSPGVRPLLRGAHVLELGAGTGLLGLAVAAAARDERAASRAAASAADCGTAATAAGAQPMGEDGLASLTLTDFNPEVLRNLRYNVAVNAPPSDDGDDDGHDPAAAAALPTVLVEKLDFCAVAARELAPPTASSACRGQGWVDESGQHRAAAAVVLAADVVASASDAAALVGTLRQVLAYPHGVAFLSLPHTDARFGVEQLAPLLLAPESGLALEITPYALLQAMAPECHAGMCHLRHISIMIGNLD
eukprot:COSAG01_NODE_2588_length_7414_cov_4.548052_4_plen_491_part_00